MSVLTLDQAYDIVTRLDARRDRFPTETPSDALLVVLLNYGDHLTPVDCIGGEWSGTKGQLAPRDGVPLCPNGHPLIESRYQVRLGLVDVPVP